jgi:hypothetical protein
MNHNFLQDLEEGATAVREITAETPTCALVHMKLTAGQIGISV